MFPKEGRIYKKRRMTRNIQYTDSLVHIYQRAVNGNVIFYSRLDILIYFMVVCTKARKWGIKLYGVCTMPDHIHLLVYVETKEKLSRFMCEYTSAFSRRYNADSGISGAVFQKRYGWAVKRGDKKIRTAIAYLYNNPVEKKLAARAENTFLNFLPYAISDHPFSEKINIKKAPYVMRKALSEIKSYASRNETLSYTRMRSFFDAMSPMQKKQLFDFIVSSYCAIDFKAVESYYGSYENMILAFNSNTGSEYDIKEERHPFPDNWYGKMTTYAISHGYVSSVKEIIKLSAEEKVRLFNELYIKKVGTSGAIAKFLHLNLEDRVSRRGRIH